MSLSALPSTFTTMAAPALADRFGPQWVMTAGKTTFCPTNVSLQDLNAYMKTNTKDSGMALRGLLIYALGCFLMGNATSPWTSTICGLLLIGTACGDASTSLR